MTINLTRLFLSCGVPNEIKKYRHSDKQKAHEKEI